MGSVPASLLTARHKPTSIDAPACENDGHKQRAYSAISVAQQPAMPADNCQVFSSALLPPVHVLSCLQKKAAGHLPSKSCPSYQQGSTTSLAMLLLQADQRGCVLVLLHCQSASTCCGLLHHHSTCSWLLATHVLLLSLQWLGSWCMSSAQALTGGAHHQTGAMAAATPAQIHHDTR